MSNESAELDIEMIMSEIRKDISAKQLKNDIPHYEQVIQTQPTVNLCSDSNQDQLLKIEDELAYLKAYPFVAAYRPLKSNRGILGPVIILYKKIMRKLLKFYFEPIIADQNEYNSHVSYTLELMNQRLVEKDRIINELKTRLL